MIRRLLFALSIASALPLIIRAASDEKWITTASAPATPASASRANVLVLLDDTTIEIDANGVATTTQRYVIRILTNNGISSATATVSYDSKVDKVRTLNSWLIRPGGKTITRNNSEWADICTEDSSTLASDMRQRFVSFTDKAVAGDIFAYESKVVGPMLEACRRFVFGGTAPALTQRVTVSAPPGFTLSHRCWGQLQPTVTTQTSGNTTTWALSNPNYRPDESWAPASATIDCDLVVRIDPPAGVNAFKAKSLQSWREVYEWMTALCVGQCDSSPALAAKARELTANCTDQLAKIRALAIYAQKLRYIANSEGLNKGLGYVPRKASLVFASGFGDCKDKSNLLRAMLREVGIEAFSVAVSTRGRDFVRPEIPSETYFNHAICAIRVEDSVQLPAVIPETPVGRLLIFDPTDSYTGLGDLPIALQGSLAHIESPAFEAPIRLPAISAEQGFKLERVANASLDGLTLKVSCTAKGNGQIASIMRSHHAKQQSPKELDSFALGMLGDSLHASAPTQRSFISKSEENIFEATLETAASDFLQAAPGGLIIAKLDILGRSFIPTLPEKERSLPIRFPDLAQDDKINLTIPASLSVAELPRSTSVEHEYGTYKQTVSYADGVVSLHRSLVLRGREIPAADFAKVKAFLSSLVRAERSALLLKEAPKPPSS